MRSMFLVSRSVNIETNAAYLMCNPCHVDCRPGQHATSTSTTMMMIPPAAATQRTAAAAARRRRRWHTSVSTRGGAICPTSCWRTSLRGCRCAIVTMRAWCVAGGTVRSICRACGRTLWWTIARWRRPSSTTIRAGSMCSTIFARRTVWRASARICAVWSFGRCTVSTICSSLCRCCRGTWSR